MKRWTKILLSILGITGLLVIGIIVYINTTFISKEEAKTLLAKYTNISKSKLYFESIELKLEKQLIEIDFYYNNQEYEAKIDAKNNVLIYTDFSGINNSINKQNNETQITLDQAKKLVLNQLNKKETNLTLISAKEEVEDKNIIYEIKWQDSIYEYDFEVSKSGEILHYDKEKIYD